MHMAYLLQNSKEQNVVLNKYNFIMIISYHPDTNPGSAMTIPTTDSTANENKSHNKGKGKRDSTTAGKGTCCKLHNKGKGKYDFTTPAKGTNLQ